MVVATVELGIVGIMIEGAMVVVGGRATAAGIGRVINLGTAVVITGPDGTITRGTAVSCCT